MGYIIEDIIRYLIDTLMKIHENNTKVYMNRYFAEQTMIELTKSLEKQGYPKESFDLQCPVSKYFSSYAKTMSPDLTIIDPDTLQPLAFFSIYSSTEEYNIDTFFDEAYHFNKHSKTLSLYPYYVVIKVAGNLQFYNLHSLLLYGKGKSLESEIATSEPTDYNILQKNNEYRIVRSKIVNKSKLQKFGKIAFAVIVPLLILIYFVLDYFKIYLFTELRLIAFAMIIISIFIPYVSQISIKDFSVILKDKQKKNKNE